MKENGKDEIQFLVLKSSQLVKKGKISYMKSQRTSHWEKEAFREGRGERG